MKQSEQFPCSIRRCICSYKITILKNSPIQEQNIQVSIFTGKRKSPYPHRIRGSFHDFKLFSDGFVYFRLSATATATATVAPTMGLLPMPKKPIISTWAGTEEEPANWASECIRPMVSVMP